MRNITPDETYDDIVWGVFEGPTWNEFHELLLEIEKYTEQRDTPFYLMFQPTIDMPKGAPFPHMRRILEIVNKEPKILHLIVVVRSSMIIAKQFAAIAAKIFPQQMKLASIVTSTEEAYALYQDLGRSKSEQTEKET